MVMMWMEIMLIDDKSESSESTYHSGADEKEKASENHVGAL